MIYFCKNNQNKIMKNKRKKIISIFITYFILTIIIMTPSFAALTELQEKAVDLNHDGKLDIKDIDLIVSQPFPERVNDGEEAPDEDAYYIFRPVAIAVDADDYIVDTTKSDKALVITDKAKLEKAIKALYTGEAQDNLMEVLNDGSFFKLQEEYNVNAVFAIAVTTIESGCGTGWSAIPKYTHNWISMSGSYKGRTVPSQGSNPLWWRVYDSYGEATLDFGDQIANNPYYFQAGKYSVKEIAPTYCSVEWGEAVVAQMNKIYQAAGITTTRKSAAYSSNGKCVQYYQGDYSNVPYGEGNIGNCGCGPTSFAMVASTITGTTITPEDAVTWCGNQYYCWGARNVLVLL